MTGAAREHRGLQRQALRSKKPRKTGAEASAAFAGANDQRVALDRVDSAPMSLLALQRSAGNQAVLRLVARSSAASARVPAGWVLQRAPIVAGFDDLVKGDAKYGTGAQKVTLPKELVKGMSTAWKGSFPGKKSQEQGGILVKTKDGKYVWKAGAAGSSGMFTPNYSDQGADEKLAVVGHTHPYDKSEGGYTGVSFSGGDLGTFATAPDPVQIVQSGKSRFMAARTAEFDKRLAGLDATKKDELRQEIEDAWSDAFKKASGSFAKRVETAVKAVCKQYKFEYYRSGGGALGASDTLKKVDTG